MENEIVILFKDKVEEFVENNPDLLETSENKINEYGIITINDEYDRPLYIKDKYGKEQFFRYGFYGIEYRKGYNGETDLEENFTYDEFGNQIKYETNKGFIKETRYDEKRRIIATWDTTGNKHIYEYDDSDRIIYEEINETIAKKTVYHLGEVKVFTYIYNSETDTISVEYTDSRNGYKMYKIKDDGTEQWFQDSELIKEITNKENGKENL